MSTSRSSRYDETEQTRWWAIGIALAITGVVAYLAVGYYQSAIPRGHFDDGVLAIQGQEWSKVERYATSLKVYPKFISHQAYLQGAIELNRDDLDKAQRLLEKAAESAEVKPRALALQGVIAYQKGDITLARQLVNQALELDNELFEAKELERALLNADQPLNRVTRCLALIDDGDVEGLKKELEALQQGSSKNQPYVSFVGGMVLMRQGEFRQALELFGQSKDVPELAIQSYVVSAEALVKLGDRLSAVQLLQQALAVDPNYVDAHRLMAAISYDQGLDDATVYHLTLVSQLAPNDPNPSRQMGLMSLQFEDYTGAISHYQEALKRQPPLHVEAEIRQELAEALVKTNQHDAALEQLSNPVLTAFEQDANTPASLKQAILATRAEALVQSGNYDEALKLANQILAVSPSNVKVALVKANILMEQNKAAEAVLLLEDATNYDPASYEAHYQLGLAYRAVGQAEPAARASARAQQLKQLREQFSQLHQVANREPSNVDVRLQLARMAPQLGLARMSVNWYQAVLGLDPNNQEAREGLQRLIEAGVLNSGQ